jgi:hypothetical protein
MKARDIVDTAVLFCIVIALQGSHAHAQQKQQVSFKVPPEGTTYTQQQNVEVGDVPNHIVRVFEIRRAFPTNAPVVNGIKVIETWERGMSDRIEGNGPLTAYSVYVMENGDKFFARMTAVVSQSSSGRLNATGIGYITGGTGKFTTISGSVRQIANFDAKIGLNETQTDIEYTIAK